LCVFAIIFSWLLTWFFRCNRFQISILNFIQYFVAYCF
jgi:hypothetical protein